MNGNNKKDITTIKDWLVIIAAFGAAIAMFYIPIEAIVKILTR